MNKKVAILGIGLVGGSIAKALKKSKGEYFIAGYDKSEVADAALNDGTIDLKLCSPYDSTEYDLIFLCLPVDLSLQIFEELAPELSEKNVLTDVCGVKGIFEEKWLGLRSSGIYIGGHPMTGKEKGGYENSDPLLFENSLYIISKTGKTGNAREPLIEIVKLLGSNIVFMDPWVHDEVVARVSHLPQILSVSLINAAAKNEDKVKYADFAAGGFRDMTRIASSDFKIWDPVIKHNKEPILKALEVFAGEISLLKHLIAAEKADELSEHFETARFIRDEIPKDSKGFLTPLHDIFVFVSDEPGVISRISTALYEQNINIKDIELLKIREGTGGTFRLSFESKDDAEKAARLLEDLGFAAKV